MKNLYGEYGVEVNLKEGSPSTAKQRSNTEVFQIQFNLYMPSSQYDPKLIDSCDQFYTCHTQVLTLPRYELPLIVFGRLSKAVDNVKSSIHFIVKHWGDCNKWGDWVEAYKSYDPYLWENLSNNQKRKCILWWKIIEFLRGMPLVKAKHEPIARKIFAKMANKLGEFDRIAKGIFVNVDIYHESLPCAALATESHMLKEVRLDRLCCICMEDFDNDVIATRLPCLHIFHGHCLLRWLENDHSCPLCREPMHHDQNSVIHCDSIAGYYGKVEQKICESSMRSRSSSNSDELQILFNLYKSNGVGCVGHFGEIERYGVEQIELESEPQLLTIPNRHCEKLQPTMIMQVLKSMGVPLYEQLPIVSEIFEVAANNNFDDGHAFINVDIYEESLSLVMNGAPNKLSATKVGIEELERVKLGKSCGICKDDFSDGLLVSRFPCLHIFHRDCILSWLERNHKCPLCRYPLPKS